MKKIKKGILPGILALFTIAFAFVVYLMKFGPVKIFRYYALVYVTAYLAWIDIEKRIVPNHILLGLVGLRLFCFVPEALLYGGYIGSFISSACLGALLGIIMLSLGNFLGRKGMGFGDIKFVGTAGFYMGPNGVLFVIFFSLLFAALYCGIMLLAKKLTVKDEIPMMPFLFGGLLVTCLLGI
ncbi:MAG: prepilin peptidase [Lachnospiraceae bacterium]|nr:prepilin peptidase [Lachnospiraceae bacterium]